MESLQEQPSDISCVICFGQVKTKNIASSAEELNKVFDNCVKFLENLIVIEPFENEAGLVFCDLCWDFELNTAKFTEHISSLQKKVLNLKLAFSAGVTHRRNQFLEGKKRTGEITGGRESICESNDASILQTDPPPTTAINIQNVQQVVESPSADIPLSETLIESVKENQSIDQFIQEAHPKNVENSLTDPEPASNENEDVITKNSDLMKTVKLPFILLNRISLDATKKRKKTVCGNSRENNSPMKKIDTENYSRQTNSGVRCSKYRGIQLNRSASKTPTFNCSKCQKTFPFQSVLNLHLKMHCKAKTLHTPKCANSKRINHPNHKKINGKVGWKKLPCSFCQKLFHPQYLKNHEKYHTGEAQYKCEICEKMFVTSSILKEHKLSHSNVKAYKCEICYKAFRRKSTLKEHAVIHTDLKQYKCEVCQRAFVRKSQLKVHEVIHTNLRPYKCEICGKAFRQKSALIRHAVIHSNLKQYDCILKKSFLQKSELKRHEIIHTEDGGHKCSFCSKIYSSASNLKLHEKIHREGSEYKCEFCNKQFWSFQQLDTHIRSDSGEKPYKCSICDKAFTCIKYMKCHERTIHSEQYYLYECSFCKKGYKCATSLEFHIRRHLGERPYICSVCKQEFSQLAQLKNHKKVHATEIQGNAVQLL